MATRASWLVVVLADMTVVGAIVFSARGSWSGWVLSGAAAVLVAAAVLASGRDGYLIFTEVACRMRVSPLRVVRAERSLTALEGLPADPERVWWPVRPERRRSSERPSATAGERCTI